MKFFISVFTLIFVQQAFANNYFVEVIKNEKSSNMWCGTYSSDEDRADSLRLREEFQESQNNFFSVCNFQKYFCLGNSSDSCQEINYPSFADEYCLKNINNQIHLCKGNIGEAVKLFHTREYCQDYFKKEIITQIEYNKQYEQKLSEYEDKCKPSPASCYNSNCLNFIHEVPSIDTQACKNLCRFLNRFEPNECDKVANVSRNEFWQFINSKKSQP